jgi:hypothetical protein
VPDEPARSDVDFIPTADVLLRDPDLAHATQVPVLGIVTRFETNSRTVADIVERAFGGWRRAMGGRDVDGARGLRVRVVVHEGSEHVAGRAPVRHICPDATRVIAHSPGSLAISDPVRGEAIVYASTALVEDGAHFRGEILEAMTLALLSHFDRHPVHAAAVGRGGRAILLAGESGAGKSTLAYAAHQMGLDVLGDDRVWVQLSPRFRVWGWPGRVRLGAEARAHFPDLDDLEPADSRTSSTGEMEKLTVQIGGGPGDSRCTADDAVVCVLERTGRDARCAIERLEPEALRDALAHRLAAGFDRFPERHDAVVDALARAGGWRLEVPEAGDPTDALSMLLRAARFDGARAHDCGTDPQT